MRVAPQPFRGHPYMPIRLKGILVRHGITHGDIAAAVVQAKGVPLSRTAVAQIINHSYYPRNTTAVAIQDQIRALLATRGVADEEVAAAFESAPADDDARWGLPLGAHLHGGQAGSGGRSSHAVADYAITIPHELFKVEVMKPATKQHFNLPADPFKNDINEPGDVFLSAEQRYIRDAMYYAALHCGFIAVIGESGAGKSVLREDLVDRINEADAKINVLMPILADKNKVSAGLLCEAIIAEMAPGTKIPQSLEARTRLVKQMLTDNDLAGYRNVLVIEESHELSVPAFKHLKQFWELKVGHKKLLGIILIGQPEMHALLDERRTPKAREVIRRCEVAHLQPLDGALEGYLRHKFQRIGVDINGIFEADVYDAIRAALTQYDSKNRPVSVTYPLIVNNFVSKLLDEAARIKAPVISAALVEGL